MSENTKRIAKNTLFLYFRMLFTMGVSLFTSRVVLRVLGVDDFGAYQTVGGIVALLSFVNNALTVGSSRFLTYELGTGDFKKLKDTFSTVLSVHILLSLIIAVVAETAGLWYVYNKLVVSPERLDAAIFAYHISILTSFITITQVPYNASIVSHERMGVYAYVSIVEVSLKLAIVYLLTVSTWDKLKVYAVLLCVVQFGVAMFYRLYCVRNFDECRYSLILKKNIFKDVLSYSGWNLISSTAVALSNQGVLVLINAFFSPAVVAARAVANQVNMAANQFVGNFRTAVNPQIVKQYAAKNYEESQNLLLESAKYSYYMMLLLCVPICMVAESLLKIWLGIVPEYAPEFLQLAVLASLADVFNQSFYTALLAKGRIRENSIMSSLILFVGFIAIFFCFKLGFSPASSAVVLLVAQSVLSFVVKPILLVKIVKYPLRRILIMFLSCLKVSFIVWPFSWIICSGIEMYLDGVLLCFIMKILMSLLIVSLTIWFVGLDSQMKQKLKSFLKKKIGKLDNMSDKTDSFKPFCYLCGKEITEKNKSEEHIILNSLGGRLKSSKLLCKDCNSNFGDKEDAALAKQMEFFATHLNIKRERGCLQNIEMTKEGSGEKYLVSSDGNPFLKHPLVEKRIFDGKLEVKVRANNEEEALQILANLQRKYPDIDIEQCRNALKKIKEPLDAPLHVQLCFGGMEAMLSILKTAVNFYIDRSGDVEFVRLAIDDLKKKKTDRVEQFLAKSRPLFESSDCEILHSIFINGSKEKNKLYAIVEFFSALQFVVKLSDDYNGEDVQYLYVYDVLNAEEIQKEIKNIPAFDFIFNYKYSSEFDFQGLQQKIARVLQIGAKRRNDNRISEIINQSIKAAWGEPDGRVLKEEDANALVNELMKKITPLIVRGRGQD